MAKNPNFGERMKALKKMREEAQRKYAAERLEPTLQRSVTPLPPPPEPSLTEKTVQRLRESIQPPPEVKPPSPLEQALQKAIEQSKEI